MTRSLEHELQTNASALRRLARSLVGPEHVDDLVQDTALSALQVAERPESLRSWLFAVLRRLAGKHHRGERRRRGREVAVQPTEPEPGPQRLAEQRDTLHALTSALAALSEPYRQTLMLRYFEELMPTAIAERMGVPVATVKTRLSRGLGLLREKLDAGERGGEWRAGLAATFGLRSGVEVGAAVGVTAGVMLMGTGMKLLFSAAAAAMAVATLVWYQIDSKPATSPSAPRANATAPAPQTGAIDAPTPPPSLRIDVTPADPSAPAALATVRGRCVDELGNGLAGVDITVHQSLPVGRQPPNAPKRTPLQLTSTAGGTFTFSLQPLPHGTLQLQFQLASRCPIHGWVHDLAPGSTKDLGDLELPCAIRVQGHVRDTDGQPVAGAHVRVWTATATRPDMFPDASAGDTTRADGSFGPCGPLPPGRGYAMVEDRRLAQRMPELHLDASTKVKDLDLVVRSDRELPPITGIVVDETGLPVTNANVSLEFDVVTQTADDGTFTLRVSESPTGEGPFTLHASREGYVPSATEPVALGSRLLRIVLRHSRDLRVHVRRQDDGAQVLDFALDLIQHQSGYPGSRTLHRDAQRWPDGIARLPAVAPGDYLAYVTPADATLRPSSFVPVEVRADTGGEVTVELCAGHRRLLRLRDSSGSPVTAEVDLIDPWGQPLRLDSYAFTIEDWDKLLGPMRLLLLQRDHTDAHGELLLRGPAGRDVWLRLRGPGIALQTHGPIRFDDEAPLDLVVPRGASWVGKVVPPDVAAALVAAAPALPRSRMKDHSACIDLRRDGEGLRNPTEPLFAFAPDGSFRIEGIPAGTWNILVWALGSPLSVGGITVREGEELHQDLDLQGLRPCAVELQLFVDGEPYREQQVALQLDYGPPALSGRTRPQHDMLSTDADGHLRWPSLPGVLNCMLFVPDGDGRIGASIPPIQVPVADHFQQVVDLRTTRLHLTVLQPDGQPAAGVEIRLTDLGNLAVVLQLDDRGSRVASVLQGHHRVRAYPRRLGSPRARLDFTKARGEAALPAELLDLGDLDVGPDTATVQLRLPPAWDR